MQDGCGDVARHWATRRVWVPVFGCAETGMTLCDMHWIMQAPETAA